MAAVGSLVEVLEDVRLSLARSAPRGREVHKVELDVVEV
jgi:hypothetical protein